MSFAELLVTQRRVSDLDKMYSLIHWERFRYRLKKVLDRSSDGLRLMMNCACFES